MEVHARCGPLMLFTAGLQYSGSFDKSGMANGDKARISSSDHGKTL